MNIEMNLVADWQDIMISQMNAEGLKFSSTTPKDSLIVRYFTYLRKKGGPPRPRRVHKSKDFICPPELNDGLDQIVDALQNGKNISPFMSKRVNEISFLDGMFNDWGVLHLHLGGHSDPRNKHATRRGPLLFLQLKDNDAYLINIYNHKDWAKKSILQTMYDNWPELIKPYTLKGILGSEVSINDDQHQTLRNSGVTVLVDLVDQNGDTIVIVPPGGFGIVASGDAMQDVFFYDQQVKNMRDLENKIKHHFSVFNNYFGDNTPDTINFKLVNENGRWILIEQSTNKRFYLYNNR